MAVTVNGVEFATIKDALVGSDNGRVMILTDDLAEDVVVYGGKKMELDLAGHTLTNVSSDTITILSGGRLTVTDSVGGGVVDCITHAKAAVMVNVGGSCVLDKGTYRRSKEDSTSGSNSWYVILNRGTMTMNDIIVEGTSSFSSAIMSEVDPDVTSGPNVYAGVDAKLIVNGMSCQSQKICIKNAEHSTLMFVDGQLSCPNECLLNWSNATIAGGTIESTGGIAIWCGNYRGSGGALTVTGGTIKSAGASDIDLVSADGDLETITPVISGGSFSKVVPAEYIASGLEAVAQADGTYAFVRSDWTFVEGGPCGVGFTGSKRFVMHRDSFEYPTGGFEIPCGFEVRGVISVSVEGGCMYWFDTENGKLVLYKSNGKEISGTVNDITVILIGI